MEEIIRAIVEEFGREIWFGFITLVITGFVLTLIRDFIKDLVYYFRARMSDVGYGQRIYYNREIFIVDRVKFKHIVAHDDKKKILIPINKFLEGTLEYPNHRYDDFDEDKYHQPPWDGTTERRHNS